MTKNKTVHYKVVWYKPNDLKEKVEFLKNKYNTKKTSTLFSNLVNDEFAKHNR